MKKKGRLWQRLDGISIPELEFAMEEGMPIGWRRRELQARFSRVWRAGLTSSVPIAIDSQRTLPNALHTTKLLDEDCITTSVRTGVANSAQWRSFNPNSWWTTRTSSVRRIAARRSSGQVADISQPPLKTSCEATNPQRAKPRLRSRTSTWTVTARAMSTT